METIIYSQTGKEADKIQLPAEIFGLPWNGDLVHQVIISMMSNARDNIAHTKGRAEVRGGGKKPWRQKGTGRARHGSSRSPIWRGGGVTFGPNKDRNFSKKINKKMKMKALFVSLSQKLRDNEILFVDKLDLAEIKTTQAKLILENLSQIKGFKDILSKKKNSAYLTLGARDKKIEKSFHNFGNILVNEVRNINPVEIAKFKYLIITNPKESVDFLISKIS
ncbi:MAG: 50S ribosomal protein L4 [Candidatus Pacebacteria bacterium]|nr:50S ribosomal protein L4 [Candidatus Paceibacterota bacterium]